MTVTPDLERRYESGDATLTKEQLCALVEYHKRRANLAKNRIGVATRTLDESGFAFVDAADFVNDETVTPPDWIVQDFIHLGAKGDILAKSKQRKTFFGLQLAASIAAGRDFFGLHVETARRVAYFDIELERWDAQRRLQKILVGLDLQIGRSMLMLSFIRGTGINLREHTEELKAKLEQNEIALAILDPRYKLMQGGEDENTADGLRSLLSFRDSLAEKCAVLIIGHDPKGDTAGKAMADRGAGSYTAGADFDFRFALSPHERGDGYSVLSFACRAKKEPPPITLRFDGEKGVFDAAPDIPAICAQPTRTNGHGKTPEQKAAENAERETAFEAAALEIANRPGALLGKMAFIAELAKTKAGAINNATRKEALKALIERGVLAEVKEQERKLDGSIRNKNRGLTFIGTPERIRAYVDSFATLPL